MKLNKNVVRLIVYFFKTYKSFFFLLKLTKMNRCKENLERLIKQNAYFSEDNTFLLNNVETRNCALIVL